MKNIFNIDKLCCGYETRRDALKGNLLFPVLLTLVTIFCFSFGLTRSQDINLFSYYAESILIIITPALLVSIYFAESFMRKDRAIKKHINNLNLNKVMRIYLLKNELGDDENLNMSLVFGYQLIAFLLLSANMLYQINDNIFMLSLFPLFLLILCLVMLRVVDYFVEVYPIKNMKAYSVMLANNGHIKDQEIYDFIITYDIRVEKRNIEKNFIKKSFDSGRDSGRI